MGVAASASIYVGDVPEVDVVGAQNAGLVGILIDAHDHHPGYASGPKIRSIEELAATWT
jgi:FMN phosphatase YigB (HAD superfamily)